MRQGDVPCRELVLVGGVVAMLQTAEVNAQEGDEEVCQTDLDADCESILNENAVPVFAVLLAVGEQDLQGGQSVLVEHLVSLAVQMAQLNLLTVELLVDPRHVDVIVCLGSAI